MRLSIIVPTMGRPSLSRTIASVAHQLQLGDEILVVADGHLSEVGHLCEWCRDEYQKPIRFLSTAETHDNGGSQRDFGVTMARGDMVLFLDDDDIYVKGALDMVRTGVGRASGLPHIFRMQGGNANGWTEAGGGAGWSGVLWREQKIQYGNVGTPMIVVPRLPGLPRWADFHKLSHDFGFIESVVNGLFAGNVVWHEEVLSIIRPNEEEARREIS